MYWYYYYRFIVIYSINTWPWREGLRFIRKRHDKRLEKIGCNSSANIWPQKVDPLKILAVRLTLSPGTALARHVPQPSSICCARSALDRGNPNPGTCTSITFPPPTKLQVTRTISPYQVNLFGSFIKAVPKKVRRANFYCRPRMPRMFNTCWSVFLFIYCTPLGLERAKVTSKNQDSWWFMVITAPA